MSSSKLYDCLILGAGPGGLSMALALGRVHRTCVVLSDSKFRNDGIHAVHNVLGHDGREPGEIRRLGREQIEKYKNTDFVEKKIVKAKKVTEGGKEYFEAQDEGGEIWKGRKLVLAMGTKDNFPPIEGYKENWPENIYQCLFCDGHERAHLPKGVLTLPSPMHLRLASIAKHQSVNDSTVTIFTDGPPSKAPPIQSGLEVAKALGIKIDQRKVKCLKPAKDIGVNVVLEDGEEVYMGFLIHKPRNSPVGEDLIRDLGVEIEETPFGTCVKKTEPFCETNVKGVFVVGDAGVGMTFFSVAMGSAVLAAGGIAQMLAEEDGKIALKKYQEATASKA